LLDHKYNSFTSNIAYLDIRFLKYGVTTKFIYHGVPNSSYTDLQQHKSAGKVNDKTVWRITESIPLSSETNIVQYT